MQYCVDRLRYALGWLPRVNGQGRMMCPEGYRAALVISADLELAWAWRYARCAGEHPLPFACRMAEQTRRNMPALLALFDRYQVPVTWAAVGHLFLERCSRGDACMHPEMPRLPYFENEYWRYATGDWFDADPGTDVQSDPAWYAPDLLQAILAAKVKHEIACHTFSHIDCSDAHCPPEVMDAELAECQRLGAERGIRLDSFVFPGNLPGNLASLKRHGFRACRWHGRYHLDIPRQDERGLWQIPGGVQWEMPEGWPVEAWIGALRRCVDRALETGTLLHLWFHPSCAEINVDAIYPAFFDYVAAHSSDLGVMTMREVVRWFGARD